MNAQRHEQVKRLFLAACELEKEAAAAFLDQACAGDAQLRREVESLLEHHQPTTIIREWSDETADGKILRPVPRIPGETIGTEDFSYLRRPKKERFAPGTVMAGRYRILGLLGRGGMGEVYRADDLKLDQPVALKFLTPGRADDEAWLRRFRSEVRLARRVTHTNVNRVHDIGEAGGEAFISMEYVDGEDLGALLRRVGRISGQRAVEIARQLCAGLGAAHDRGVLHRDLKPANVMIDGNGQVRIMDFGIAAVAAELEGVSPLAGTPAFMAPELFEGKDPSVRSDIYSLGVVLYEMVTGKEPFDGVAARQRSPDATPAAPSSVSADVDLALERIILRCLRHQPQRRPQSTHAMAAALPGCDPLAEALAAGQTPSPGMVAAAGSDVRLRGGVAIAYLAAALAGLIVVVCLAKRTFFLPQTLFNTKPPAVLADKAQQIIARLGHEPAGRGSMRGLAIDRGYLDYMTASDARHRTWDHLPDGRPAAAFFWYRQGDNRLIAPPPLGEPALRRKLPAEPGMNTVRLDGQGRLLRFTAVPDRSGLASLPTGLPDWLELFELADLDVERFDPIHPVREPPVFADRLAAWEGSYPDRLELPLRIEAASLGQRVVYFDVVPPWEAERPPPGQDVSAPRVPSRTFVMRFVLYAVVLAGGIVLSRRNLRKDRADLRGAKRLAATVLGLALLDWLLGERHVGVFAEEAASCYLGMARATLAAAVTWVCYVAMEPYVRRFWPQTMISWSRLLSGRWRDPLLGRDVLVGGLFGIGLVLVVQLDWLAAAWLGYPLPVPKLPGAGFDLGELLGLRYKLGTVIGVLLASVSFGLIVLLLMLLLRVTVRVPLLATAAFCVVLTTAFTAASQYDVFLPWVTNAVLALAIVFVLTRVGLIALIVGWLVRSLLLISPITANFAAWYAPAGVFALIVVAALLIYGFHTALAGRPVDIRLTRS